MLVCALLVAVMVEVSSCRGVVLGTVCDSLLRALGRLFAFAVGSQFPVSDALCSRMGLGTSGRCLLLHWPLVTCHCSLSAQ